MKRVAIISRYPLETEIIDGMSQRIIEIDEILYDKFEADYFDLSFKRNLRPSIVLRKSLGKIERIIREYKYNSFLHKDLIYKVLENYDKIYIHSIMNFIYIVHVAPKLSGRIVLDIHGAVPDELILENKYLKSIIFNGLEGMALNIAQMAVCVSESMIKHYRNKYPNISCDFMLLPTSSRIPMNNDIIPHHSRRISVIYAGGTQKWQNLDLMYGVARSNPDVEFHMYFPQKFAVEMSGKFALCNIKIGSLSRADLLKAYNDYDFGLILRDDNVINRVANPTKLLEYVAHGVIPIVLQPRIGDLELDGYKYSTVDSFMKIERREIEYMREHNLQIFKKNVLKRERLIEEFLSFMGRI